MALIRAGFVAVVAAAVLLLAQSVDGEQTVDLIIEHWDNAECSGKKLTTQEVVAAIKGLNIDNIWEAWEGGNKIFRTTCREPLNVPEYLRPYGWVEDIPGISESQITQQCLCEDESKIKIKEFAVDPDIGDYVQCTPDGIVHSLGARRLHRVVLGCGALNNPDECKLKKRNDGREDSTFDPNMGMLCWQTNLGVYQSHQLYIPSSSSGGLPWWAWLLIALGIEHAALMAWYYSTLGITWKFWKYYQRLYADIMARLF